MQGLYYAHLTEQTLAETVDGGQVGWPVAVEGDDWLFKLRLVDSVDGIEAEVQRTVQALKATLGRRDLRPTSGSWGLIVDGNPLNELTVPFDVTATALRDAIAALPEYYWAAPDVVLENGTYTITIPAAAVAITPADNSLAPTSFIRVTSEQKDGKSIHRVRLTEAPVAMTDTLAVVVPPAPSIDLVRAGFSDNAGTEWNEVQRLTVPLGFRGRFEIQFGARKTALLGRADGPAQIQAALNAMIGDAGSFTVTQGLNQQALIEFGGDLSSSPQPLMTVNVHSAPPGDLQFTLPLGSTELFDLFARAGETEIDLVLEIELHIEDEQDGDTVRVWSHQSEVTVARDIAWEELGLHKPIDWLKPPLPVNYIPFTTDQVITGAQHYVTTIGDGTLMAFNLAHNLGTEALHVTVRENQAGGRILEHGADYDYVVTVDNANAITITTDTIWAAGALAVVISTAGPVSAFQAHTHTIAQIEGLQAYLDDHAARITTLEGLAPAGGLNLTVGGSGGEISRQVLPPVFDVFPSRREFAEQKEFAGLAALKHSALPRQGRLLRAFPNHDEDAYTPAVDPLPDPTTAAAGIYRNDTAGEIAIPAKNGLPAAVAAPGDYIANDGVQWYPVRRESDDSTYASYWPTAFERELFRFALNGSEFRLDTEMVLHLGMEFALLGVERGGAQFEIQIDAAAVNEEAGGPSANLEEINWGAAPLVAQRFFVTQTPKTHHFGLKATRYLNGATDTIKYDQILYGRESGTGVEDAGAIRDLFFRARLLNFDTENMPADATGFIGVRGLAVPTPKGENEGTVIVRAI